MMVIMEGLERRDRELRGTHENDTVRTHVGRVIQIRPRINKLAVNWIFFQ